MNSFLLVLFLLLFLPEDLEQDLDSIIQKVAMVYIIITFSFIYIRT